MHAVSPYPTLACSLALLCTHTQRSINIIVKPQEKMLQKGTYLKMIKAPWSHLRKPQKIFFSYKLLCVRNSCSLKYLSQRFKYLPFLGLYGKSSALEPTTLVEGPQSITYTNDTVVTNPTFLWMEINRWLTLSDMGTRCSNSVNVT